MRKRQATKKTEKFDDVISCEKSHKLIESLKTKRGELKRKTAKAADVCSKAFEVCGNSF